MVSTHYEGINAATAIYLFYPRSRLIVNSSQPEPTDLQSPTGSGNCKHALTSIQRKRNRLNKESRRLMANWKAAYTSEQSKKAGIVSMEIVGAH